MNREEYLSTHIDKAQKFTTMYEYEKAGEEIFNLRLHGFDPEKIPYYHKYLFPEIIKAPEFKINEIDKEEKSNLKEMQDYLKKK